MKLLKMKLSKFSVWNPEAACAEADLRKDFLFQDDHEGDQAEKNEQFVNAHCAQQALFPKSCC